MMVALIFGVFVLVLLIGCPIAIALLLGGIVPIMALTDIPLGIVVQRLFSSANSYSMMAVPFFILAGNLMDTGGVSKRLVNLARSLVGWLPGGLAVVSLLACAFFGAISGSAPATVAAIGSIMIPSMKEDGYPMPFILATIASGGWLGVIVPPSIPMVLYCISVGSVAITDVFLGGFIPGFLLAGGMSVYAVLWGRKHMRHATRKFSIHEVGRSFVDALWALGMPIIILGGIYSGIATPTEAACISVFYALLVSMFCYHTLKLSDLPKILYSTVESLVPMLFVAASATVFARVLSMLQAPQQIASIVTSAINSKILILLIINAFLLVIGMLMDAISAILICVPIFMPICTALGIDPIHFGVLMTCNLAIGFVTPPVGVNLFVASSMTGIPVLKIARSSARFIAWFFAALMMITFVPQISLLLLGG